MAVDTANKRYSMINFGTPIPSILIIPDGTIASADMYHFLNLYFGITLTVSQTWTAITDTASTTWTNVTDTASTTWTEVTDAS